MKRKIIHHTVNSFGCIDTVTCEDGTVWKLGSSEWQEVTPPLPDAPDPQPSPAAPAFEKWDVVKHKDGGLFRVESSRIVVRDSIGWLYMYRVGDLSAVTDPAEIAAFERAERAKGGDK